MSTIIDTPPLDLQLMYENWPQRDRKAILTDGNNKYPTQGLFIETATNPNTAIYTLGPEPIFGEGKTYHSAWMIYVHADDEYDALRKLVGTVKHWEILKRTSFFMPILEEWQKEQGYVQKSRMKKALLLTALAGGPGNVSAARTVLQMVEGSLGAKGRPAKQKDVRQDDGDVNADVERMRALGK